MRKAAIDDSEQRGKLASAELEKLRQEHAGKLEAAKKELNKSSDEVKRMHESHDSCLNQLRAEHSDQQKKLSGEISALRKTRSELNAREEQQTKELKELKNKLRETQSSHSRMMERKEAKHDKEIETWKAQTLDAEKKYRDTEEALKKTKKALDVAEIKAKQREDQVLDLQRQLIDVGRGKSAAISQVEEQQRELCMISADGEEREREFRLIKIKYATLQGTLKVSHLPT